MNKSKKIIIFISIFCLVLIIVFLIIFNKRSISHNGESIANGEIIDYGGTTNETTYTKNGIKYIEWSYTNPDAVDASYSYKTTAIYPDKDYTAIFYYTNDDEIKCGTNLEGFDTSGWCLEEDKTSKKLKKLFNKIDKIEKSSVESFPIKAVEVHYTGHIEVITSNSASIAGPRKSTEYKIYIEKVHKYTNVTEKFIQQYKPEEPEENNNMNHLGD
jgi:hypothetical protein